MDSIINAALEEICSQVEDGITLETLWQKLEQSSPSLNLTPPFSPSIKKAIWSNLLTIPTLRFDPPNPNPENPNLKIFAQQTLSDNFIGLYHPQSLKDAQIQVLRLLADARHNGITQSQLAKLLRIDANNFFYVLRILECQGLILKRSAIEKTKQVGAVGHSSKSYTPLNVPTHLVYLRRYAKEITSHQRFEFEITKFNNPQDDDHQISEVTTSHTDVLLKDYTPSMKAITDKLANANGKVLTLSDLRKDLGYSGSRPKQRAWRQICSRLKTHNIVEQFDAMVHGKIEPCLRLLDPVSTGSVNEDRNINSGKICQVTDQLVELPIDYQIVDMIDAAGSDGITIKELCERLEIDIKKTHSRLINLCYRFGMKVQEEQVLKSKTIRVWTSRNFNPELEATFDQHVLDCSPKDISESEASTFNEEFVDPSKLEDIRTSAKLTRGSFSADTTRRANRILEILKDERFILRAEIGRLLNSVEKDKSKKVDRKTIDRILNKLQEQGQCKCITVHSPLITEYSRTKDDIVVVHPSISLSPELFDEIQDKVRSFNNYIRSTSTCHQKNDELIPVLEDIQKTERLIVPNRQADIAEARRANGFILSKMIRAKLLHSFLWEYVHMSESHKDAVSSNELTTNPHSSSKLFSLEAAIKAIKVELFLQVVGSTQKYEEMIEKCKMGLCLSDLPHEEYKCLMDTQATGRLSSVIDILRRLKLIRMTTVVQSRDGVETPQTLTHMMELRPYIEEPLVNIMSVDFRPRIRHDFILSSTNAVGEYWRTLEYCYAAANKKAAIHAFPGSVVPEVFRFRSWASNRLMTAEQRAELLKCVAKADLSEKISYKDCENIAKDLNLTLEQVLSMYYSKRRHCHNQLNDDESENNSPECKGSSSRRRKKKYPESRPEKHARVDSATDVRGKHIDELHGMGIHSGENAHDTQEFEEGNCEIQDSQNSCPPSSPPILTTMKQPRQRRFVWTDKNDRQLVIQYVRHRAALGAKYHRTDWVSLSDLPAPPSNSRRRMIFLNSNSRFRKAVNRLCNILSERYAKQLEKSHNLSLNKDDCKLFVRPQSNKCVDNSISPDVEIQTTNLAGEAWDDFENESVKGALDEVLRCKMMSKLDVSTQNIQSQYEGWSVAEAEADGHESPENGKLTSAIPSEIIQSHCGKPHTFSSQIPRCCRLDMKFTRFLNNRPNVYGQVHGSLAVSNAVELFKLVFLSTATSLQAPNLLADVLRHYSEHDLFAAFNYLREKKIMVGGDNSEHFELSLQFLHSVSKSPFPFDTGKRAVKFSAWLQERDKDLTEMGTDLAEDLQCGDIFHLFALISSGELSISPNLPDNGVGEADELRSSKRKSDANESFFGDKAKKLKTLSGVEGEIISRREKGFPGIVISAHRTRVSRADILDLFKDKDNMDQHFEGNFQLNIGQSINHSLIDHMPETFSSCDPIPAEENHIESPWEAMAGYAHRLISVPSDQEQECAVSAEVFRVVYAAIQKAGDQGLSMGEISQVINLPGEVNGLIVDALQVFGRALKVNAYDSVRIVDALYRHKYFLTPMTGFHQCFQPSSKKIIKKSDKTYKIYKPEENDVASADVVRERNSGVDDVHKVTILNHPCVDVDPENQVCERIEGCMQDGLGSSRVDHEKEMLNFSSSELCVPIWPWINGDGTINDIVYKGLRRRVLGIVMQNPGILEDDILPQMHVLNPQSCRTLLGLMVLDKHLIVRKMYQNISRGVPSMLQDLMGSKSGQPKLICRDHFFANPMSTSLL